MHLSCLPPNISRELRGSPRRRLGHENRIMPFRLPQNNHTTCDHIIGRNSCRRDMTNAGMFLMDSSSPCLFSLASASIMSIERLAPNLDMTLRNKPGLRSPTVRIVVVIDVEIVVIYFCWCPPAGHWVLAIFRLETSTKLTMYHLRS